MTRSMARWLLTLAVLVGGVSASPAVAGDCDAALSREQRKLARALRRIERAERGEKQALAERDVALREAKELTALSEAERKRAERLEENFERIIEEL